MDCSTLAEKSGGSASPNWSATMRWMDCSRSVVGAGETMCSKQIARCGRWASVAAGPYPRAGGLGRRRLAGGGLAAAAGVAMDDAAPGEACRRWAKATPAAPQVASGH
jgi:hypothetical protein